MSTRINTKRVSDAAHAIHASSLTWCFCQHAPTQQLQELQRDAIPRTNNLCAHRSQFARVRMVIYPHLLGCAVMCWCKNDALQCTIDGRGEHVRWNALVGHKSHVRDSLARELFHRVPTRHSAANHQELHALFGDEPRAHSAMMWCPDWSCCRCNRLTCNRRVRAEAPTHKAATRRVRQHVAFAFAFTFAC
jgi:hypothetical protein